MERKVLGLPKGVAEGSCRGELPKGVAEVGSSGSWPKETSPERAGLSPSLVVSL